MMMDSPECPKCGNWMHYTGTHWACVGWFCSGTIPSPLTMTTDTSADPTPEEWAAQEATP